MCKIIVGDRRSGKTNELIKFVIENALKGNNVLFVSGINNEHRKLLTETLISNFKDLKIQYTLNHRFEIRLEKSNSVIKISSLKSLEDCFNFKSGHFTDYIKVLDEAFLDTINFDMISINGSCVKDINDGR